MRKLITIAAVGAMAIVASLSTTAQSQAFFPVLGIVGLAAAGASVAVAADVAGDPWYHDGYFGGYGWNAHVAACEDNYRSYDFRTDTYVRKVNGHLVRVYCEL